MNQKVKVTVYSPNHEGLGGLEYIVTGLQFNEGRVTVQTTSGPLDTTIDELAREGRHDTIINQILGELKDDGMSKEEESTRKIIRRGVEAIVFRRAWESYVAPGIGWRK